MIYLIDDSYSNVGKGLFDITSFSKEITLYETLESAPELNIGDCVCIHSSFYNNALKAEILENCGEEIVYVEFSGEGDSMGNYTSKHPTKLKSLNKECFYKRVVSFVQYWMDTLQYDLKILRGEIEYDGSNKSSNITISNCYSLESDIVDIIVDNDKSIDDAISDYITTHKKGLMSSKAILIDFTNNWNSANVLLRFAMHIRLDQDTYIKYLPILFMTDEYKVEKLRKLLTSEYANIVLTRGCEYIAKSDIDNISNIISNCMLTKQTYTECYERLSVEDYKNTHSLANIWAIQRWSKLFGIEIAYNSTIEKFKKSLYYKYVSNNPIVSQDKVIGNIYSCKIHGINNKKIAFIDDECLLGWKDIFHVICKNSDANACVCECFEENSKENRIKQIKSWLDAHEDIDCYVIDLRLHKDDEMCNTPANLSGIQIAKYIHEQNYGNQIVVFSASNKIWNMEEALKCSKAIGYVRKESPTEFLSADNSFSLFRDFSVNIKKACDYSYIKGYYNSVEKFFGKKHIPNVINLFIDSLINDNGRYAIINIAIYLEEKLNNIRDMYFTNDRPIFFSYNENKRRISFDISLRTEWRICDFNSAEKWLRISTLRTIFNDEEMCSKYYELVQRRNRFCHDYLWDEKSNAIFIQLARYVFEKIFCPVMVKYPENNASKVVSKSIDSNRVSLVTEPNNIPMINMPIIGKLQFNGEKAYVQYNGQEYRIKIVSGKYKEGDIVEIYKMENDYYRIERKRSDKMK